MRIEHLIDRAVARHPQKVALICAERRWTYAALAEELDRRAAVLVEAGVQPGEIVLTSVPATDDLTITALACCRAAVVMLPISGQLAPGEMAALAAQARPRMILTGDGAAHPVLTDYPALPLALPGTPGEAAHTEAQARSTRSGGDAPAMLRTTSGTTRTLPKLAILPHRQFTWRRSSRAWWETGDGVYCKPQEHLIGPYDIFQVFALGATLVQTAALAPDRLEHELARHGVTDLWTVPARLHPLAQSPHPPPAGLRLRAIRTGSAPLPPGLREAIARRYGVPVVQTYGSSEMNFIIATPPRETPTEGIGTALPGVTIRLVDEDGRDVPEGEIGELIARPPATMLGYLADPAATAAILRDGWVYTGDLARRDAAGGYALVGRRSLLINTGGRKVSPEEVEAILVEHPGVREAVVVAAPDAARGAIIRAIIVPEGPPPTVSELGRFCRARLAAYKVPRQFEFRDTLPRSPLGKVLRAKL
jgi:acyl-coenzyme A synthetase/AMP-(fatty) acid ligase